MRVSIVTISFNQVRFLEEAVKSVIGQDFSPIEYIVVDPGSTDGSRDAIERYRESFSCVIYDPDKGPADGLNKGFAVATGDIFGFLNSDDVLLPGTIKRVVEFFCKNPDVDVVSGHTFITDSSGSVIRKSFSDRLVLKPAAYGSAVLMQQSTFFRASAYRKSKGFNIENRIAWDGELFIDMALNGAKFQIVDEFWSEFRLHDESITSSMRLHNAYRRYREYLFRKIMGRDFRYYDYIFTVYYRLLKYASNPRGLYERLTKGPIYGRSLRSGSRLSFRHLLGRQLSKDFRTIKKSSIVRRNLSNSLTPLARWLIFQVLHKAARFRLSYLPLPNTNVIPVPAIYIVGCGRSGTTILGEILEAHKSVRYLFEPVYFWREICPATDVTEFFGPCDAKALFGSEMCSDQARQFFICLTRPGLLGEDSVLLEKTPHNAWRIGFLESLTPNSKYVHILRDGLAVANSINNIATRDDYKIAFMPHHNSWWGVNDAKWRHLTRDCIENGYFADEIALLKNNFQRGALEWVVSLLEMEKWQEVLGDRLLSIRLEDLRTRPTDVLKQVCEFLELIPDARWVESAELNIKADGNDFVENELILPPKLCKTFNALQEHWGFSGRAAPLM